MSTTTGSESPIANSPSNRLLAQFNLEGIPPAPRGVPQIEVTFDIDHNGILNVTAKDLSTGKEQKVRIESSSGISPSEVERMRKEAESHAEEDRRKRDLIDARNQADQLVYQVEKMMKEAGDKLSESDKAPVQSAIARVREVMQQAIIHLFGDEHMSRIYYHENNGEYWVNLDYTAHYPGGPYMDDKVLLLINIP